MAEHQTKTLDERFDEVQHAFLEQRDFITFCFDRAQQNLATGLAGVNHRLDRHELVLSEILNEVKALRG